MAGHMVFTVTAEQLTDCWHVHVDAGQAGHADCQAPDARTALECAVPFMRVLCEPDPFEAAFGPLAQDGPPDMGGHDGN